MANPFRTVNQMPMNNMANIRNMYQALMSSKNPMQMFEQMAKNNPSMQPIVNALKSGQNPQALFEGLCRQKGIDPNEFLRQIQGR